MKKERCPSCRRGRMQIDGRAGDGRHRWRCGCCGYQYTNGTTVPEGVRMDPRNLRDA